MSHPPDGTSPGADTQADIEDEPLLDRQKRARELAEQSWRDFFMSLAIRTAVVAAIVVGLFLLLRLVLSW